MRAALKRSKFSLVFMAAVLFWQKGTGPEKDLMSSSGVRQKTTARGRGAAAFAGRLLHAVTQRRLHLGARMQSPEDVDGGDGATGELRRHVGCDGGKP